LVQGGWPVGALVAAGLTAVLLPVIGWQGCFIFAAIPSLIVAVLARKLRETPQFIRSREVSTLRKQGQPERENNLGQEHGLEVEQPARAGLALVFQGSALRATLFLGLAFFLNWFAIQVFSVLGTTVITAVHQITFENSLVILVLSNVVGYLGYLAHGYAGDRIGRRNAIAVGWMLGGIAFAAMLWAGHDFGMVVLLYSVGLFFLIGPYAALLFFIGESYPTLIRATGGGIINALGPVGAIVAGIGATAILQQGGNWQTAALLFGALPCFLSGLLVLGAKHIPPHQRIQLDAVGAALFESNRMCAFCGLFSSTNPSWIDVRSGNGPARAARLNRIRRLNELLSIFRLTLSDQQGAYYVLSGATGKVEVISSLSETWAAAERILGKRLDPLSPDLLSRLEARNEGTKTDSV
jgi:MFS family permease